jgi:Type II secretion system (T2SS), protein N
MKKALVALLVLCVIVIGAFFFAPSSLVDGWLKRASGGQFAIKNSDGSVWSGQGELSVALPDGGVTLLPGVKWRVDPLSAITGKLVAELSGAAAGKISVEGNERVAKDVKLNISASALAAAAIIGALAPLGNVDVTIPNARWSKESGDGNGEMIWSNASVQLPNSPVRTPLGTVRVQGQLTGPNVNFTVMNDGGALALSGGGQWPRGGTARYDVAFTPRPGFAPDQLAALSSIARPDAAGAYRLRLP